MISTGCSADFDCSHDVDGSDLAILASDFNRTDCSETAPCEGDINGDGAVDTDDLTLFAAEFGRTDCPYDEFYYFHNDHLGTPQRVTDQTGTIVWSANYKPFGEANITTNTIPNPFRFPGQYYDQETGLHYNYFRYYDPGIGRYLRPDPLWQIDQNLFLYLSNRPLSGYDFRGLYRELGGGFGITIVLLSASMSVHTDICCDQQGNKHLRTIQTFCIGLELGMGLKGSQGASASLSDDQKPSLCPRLFDKTGWYSEDSGVWGALIIGRSYSTSMKKGGWKVGFGGGWNIHSGCRNEILKDVITGKCCEK